MKKNILPFLSLLILLVAGCKLDDPDFSNTGNDGNQSGSGIGTGSYQPITKDSYWKYNQTVSGNTTTQTQTMTGATATFNGKIYYTLNTVSAALGAQTGYCYHGNDTYSLRAPTEAGITVEYVYLKDNYAIGKTWTTTMTDNGSINGVPEKEIGKIVEADFTKTVSGKTFKNVVHSQVTIQYDLGNGFETVQTQDYFIARGVGIIELDSTTDFLGIVLLTTSVITDYSIK